MIPSRMVRTWRQILGPKCPSALFDALTTSSEFSPWKTDTAHAPGAMPGNSQIACP
jgi:hypothetical protein